MPAIKKLTPDRGRIVPSDADQVKYLSRHLGVSEEELLRAAEKVGNSTSAVRKELGKEVGKELGKELSKQLGK